MIAKTTIGRSFKGCCGYNLAKVEAGQGEVLLSQGVRNYEQAAMVADFTRQAKLNPDLSRSVWHTAISFSPADAVRLATDPDLMKRVALDYLTGMGLAESQYAVVRHDDTGHAHFHIIANRVANNGQTVDDSHNYRRSAALLRQIEHNHGLTPMVEQTQRNDLTNVPERDRQRLVMRDQVRACLAASTSGAEFREALRPYGIRLLVNTTETGQARGITFEQAQVNDQGEETRTAFKGSKLHQTLSVGGIQAQLTLNGQARERQRLLEAQKPAQEPRSTQTLPRLPIDEKTPEIGLKQGRGPRLR